MCGEIILRSCWNLELGAKVGQKEGFPGRSSKSRAKAVHGRAPCKKQNSLAAMPP